MNKDLKHFLEKIANLLIQEKYRRISEYFSPWLNDSSGKDFERIIWTKVQQTRDAWSDVEIGQPESFEIDDNPLKVEELREDIQAFPTEITKENFQLWCCISILTDGEEWSLYDLWLAIVKDGKHYLIGYYEVMGPD